MNLFERISSEQKIFKNEEALMPDFIPVEINNRENEIKEIATSINALIKGRKGENLFLIGPPGTGKTCCSKYILNELGEHTQRVLPIYINCWEHSSRFVILGLIARETGMVIPRRGVSIDEITDRLIEGFKKSKYKGMVIVLDEIDRLFISKEEEAKVLYDLSRAKENFGINTSIICISNSKNVLVKLDNRIRSSLSPRSLEFRPYSPTALKNILNQRAKLAFFPGALEDEVIPLCAAIGLNHGGDARVSINALWKAGKDAESKDQKKVYIKNVENIKEKDGLGKILDYSIFSKKEKKILNIIQVEKEIKTNELYKRLRAKESAKRTVRNYLKGFEKRGIIRIEKIEGKGNKRKIIFIGE